ncbi:MAG TPA: hypothetical protein VN025_05980 [Candidatus Dormibacteraeota bacterium]|jgi:hypothetical protein|nr:hypothetical protein [Candidatus Dormibacteraeota bacterium]
MVPYSFNARIDFDTTPSASDSPQIRAGRLKRILALCSVGFLMMLLTGCGATTVFQSSFDSNTVGAPPSHNQSTGTIDVSSGPGATVTIVSPPPNATGNWAQIQRIGGPETPLPAMQCNLAQSPQDGTYGLLAVLYIPSGSGLATVEFDTSAQSGPPSQGFLHLDFGDFTLNNAVHKNTVRINDDSGTLFGSFPRDQFFTLAVTLVISSSTATAHMSLYGNGASGNLDFNNITPLPLARQFGEVKFYIGFPWNGHFDATNIIVTRKN